jgi:carbamoyltransferase
MTIVGIHDGHNASACLLEDGHIVAAIQEERLRRVKNWSGFPEKAVEFVLRAGGRSVSDVDTFAFAGLDMPDQMTLEERLAFYRRDCFPPPPGLLDRLRSWSRPAADSRKARLRPGERLGIPAARSTFIDHHLCHAAAAYYGWGRYNEDVLVLTNDGEGDGLSASVNLGRNGHLHRVASVPRTQSIASLYAVTTFLLGMTPLEHEYKLMGLAPYAPPRDAARVLDKYLALIEPDAEFGWHRANGCPPTLHSYSYLRRLLERDRFDAIAGGLQSFIERRVLDWVRRCIARTGVRQLALSGGIFMNVKLNKLILEMPEVADLFVFPSCGDETNCFGAAFHVQAARDHAALPPLGPIYFGGEWSRDEIARELEGFRFDSPVAVSENPHLERCIASLLACGHIVARFAGRSEVGARALGNRSILADPASPSAVKTINRMIKSRDFWMPFATSFTDFQAPSCMHNRKRIPSPYMILAFDTTEQVRHFSAGVHPQDLTVRPQVLERSWNPPYYDLMCEFARLTGRPAAVLNTSLNLHGHPLVESPADALDVFNRSGLTHLALGDYLIVKS